MITYKAKKSESTNKIWFLMTALKKGQKTITMSAMTTTIILQLQFQGDFMISQI
jgi:hypothetical protein